tara:strand:+ start:190 stop:426 length:237 start_codon:yes stop_codon:yes gene_type:complete
MKELIEALQILLKYGNPNYPTHCEHDELSIHGIKAEDISKDDVALLDKLGFTVWIEGVENDEHTPNESKIFSYKYGSC